MKIGLFFQEITIITEFRGSNILLPTFLAGSKWDFPVANLLLATDNFELRLEDYLLMKITPIQKKIHSLNIVDISP